ncbi:NAD-dependent epimerase/dehydratase family protein [Lactiplantibacillus argentoratensis]|uniref:NAD-dependent epimerase/dehydratase family protein n=1 Tax=Lactiplantibacillus argentoratensis TaxID=271881 RepID=UPI001B32ED2D|nr:NAD-dependent epimerase/dehydratase family protein [Lactiplantibacillus argentoratensis]MBP5810192.1 GDP-mannose 4,6-dehydratase [Lactiplantibacillus argentoratensis]
MKALITGGAGFIGSHLAEKLSNEGVEVFVVDDLSMGKKENLQGLNNVKFYQKDVRDYAFINSLLLNEKFDLIFWLAAVASVADSVSRPMFTHSINQEAVLHSLDFIRANKIQIKKFLFTSSAAVYGDSPEIPKKESSAINPKTPYAVDKYAAERYVIDYSSLYQIPTVCVRFFNVFGPKQNPNSPYSGVISLITDCLRNKKMFMIFGDGKQSRDFVYIDDVINALVHLVKTNKDSGVYNIACGKETSLNELIATYEKVSGIKLEITNSEERVGDIKRSVADISKLLEIGFKPKVSVREGLTRYWEYVANRENL